MNPAQLERLADHLTKLRLFNLKTSVDEVQRSPNAGRLRIWH